MRNVGRAWHNDAFARKPFHFGRWTLVGALALSFLEPALAIVTGAASVEPNTDLGMLTVGTFVGAVVALLFALLAIGFWGRTLSRKLGEQTAEMRSLVEAEASLQQHHAQMEQQRSQILEDINTQIERFLLVQVFTSVLVGLASWIAFWYLGLQQAAIWALGAGLFNSIPYFGPVVVTGGVFVVSFLQFGTLDMALLISGVALAITSLEGFLLTPWLTSRAASMNAVAIFVGLLFWSWVWGVWGTLLAVPMLMVLKAVADHIEDLHAVSELLGD